MPLLLSSRFWGADLVARGVCLLFGFGVAAGTGFESAYPPVGDFEGGGEGRYRDAERLAPLAEQGTGWCCGDRAGEGAEDLVGDVSLQAADDVSVGEPFGATASEVGCGARFLVSHPQEHDPVQRTVRFPVPSTGQAVADSLSGRRGDRGGSAERGERCRGGYPFGVVARRGQK